MDYDHFDGFTSIKCGKTTPKRKKWVESAMQTLSNHNGWPYPTESTLSYN
jgi:hypothetical protein